MKRIVTLFFVALFTLLSSQALAHEFDDVGSSNQYRQAIKYLVDNGAVKETRYFYPDRQINMAALVTYLVKTENLTSQCDPQGLVPDAFEGEIYEKCLQKAIELGILDIDPNKFEHYKAIYPKDAFYFLFRTYGLVIPRVYTGEKVLPTFLQGTENAPLFMEALKRGMISESELSRLIAKDEGMTRAEVAQVIYDAKMALMPAPKQPSTNPNSDLAKIEDVLNLVEEKYLFYNTKNLTREQLINAALVGVSQALGDSYSTYMSIEQTENFKDSLKQEFDGAGAYIEPTLPDKPEETYILIISVIEGSPAEAAGLKAGDVIKGVDGVDIKGFTTLEAATLIRGPRGTTVSLLIQRGEDELMIDVVRDKVEIVSTDYEIKTTDGKKVMYVQLNSFGQNTFREFKDVIQIMRDENLKGMIIDLRDNPGGLLDAVVYVLSLFVPQGEVIVSIEQESSTRDIPSSGFDDVTAEFPALVVLTNERSASASEIMAGVLQKYGLATIVGETTFGKGSVQQLFSLNDGSSFKLTIAHYLLGGEVVVDGVGITPDIEVIMDERIETAEDDIQLQKALEELEKMM